jgi:lipopolysaccharide transport system permease protein
MLFATGIASAGNSVVSSESIITKIYFPRLLVPFASVAAAVVDSACAVTVLFVMLLYYRVWPGWTILLVPGIIGLTSIAALGVGTLLAALNVAYRDVKYVIPFLVQMWMFATPAIYMQIEPVAHVEAHNETGAFAIESRPSGGSGDTVRQRANVGTTVKPLLALNPMNSMVAFFRAAVLGRPLPWGPLLLGVCVSAVILLSAVLYFRRVESTFADVI